MKLQIELSHGQLVELFNSGLLHPSDIKCLNSQSKESVKQMCLQLCQPNRCYQCDRRDQCARVLFDAGSLMTKAETEPTTLS
ncbi:MAG: hypothetical protein R3189_09245 [Thiomicrorhabdus chilensis]|uniref:hypothetical protein n=1 Tax=Thiomicrorhabdus chilensis TaxID=63656 RepID=UPI00299DE476|nr:hypothetical protein [Thiomicrorhabdus chilensis]MDX1348418.1 hypothetical protein [Thiomicrorhabdus chilensis]